LALALNEKVSKIDEKARSYLEKAHSSTEHLGKLFQDLLTSAKAEDGRLTSHPTAVNVTEFTIQLVEDLRFSAEKKGLALEMQSSTLPQGSQKNIAPVYYAKVDPDRLREVITNLFDNAVKYTDIGKITIGITGNADVVQFSITDTGHGIPKADIPHMFQKFYRVDNSATRTIGGTGLGLFICRKIVELYGGKIWVESEENKGSTFYINLPRLDTKQALQLQSSGATIEPTMQNP
jgi:two-component system sensor histidine kinase VicK